MKTGILAT